MANGRLGANDLAAASDTTVYTCPADTFAVVTVSVCNRSSGTRNLRVALADGATPTNAEYIEFGAEVLANGVLERTGIVMAAGQRIVVRSDSIDVSAVVYGIETATS